MSFYFNVHLLGSETSPSAYVPGSGPISPSSNNNDAPNGLSSTSGTVNIVGSTLLGVLLAVLGIF